MSIHSHLEQLRIIHERVGALETRVRNLADVFNGSEPEEPKLGRPVESGHTLNNQFGEVISNIQDTLGAISRQTDRLEKQLFDNVPDYPLGGTAKSTRNF